MTKLKNREAKEIIILIPGWIDKKVVDELYEHIKSLCHLLADDELKVLRE